MGRGCVGVTLDIRQPRQPGKLRGSSRRLMGRPRIYLRALKLYRPKRAGFEDITPLPGLNQWETRVYYALLELKIRFSAQTNLGGGNILGGARADFLLPDWGIDLEVAGPFHFLAGGKARDLLRSQTVQAQGYRLVTLTVDDLPNLKKRILELIGAPIGRFEVGGTTP